MAIGTLDTDLNVIQQLDDLPNAVGGLSADALKAKFDEAGLAIQGYLNQTVVPAINGIVEQALPDNSVTTAKIVDGAVTNGKLADASVGTSKLVNTCVTTGKINDGAVTAAKLASNAVQTAKISDSAVTAAKLGSNAVETAKIKDKAVATAKLDDAAVTTAKLANTSVTAGKLDLAKSDDITLGDGTSFHLKIDGKLVLSQYAYGLSTTGLENIEGRIFFVKV